ANLSRVLTWVVNDGSASNSTNAPQFTTIVVTAVNDAPTLTGTADVTYTENTAAVTLAGAASVSDPDNQNVQNATVAITSGAFAGDGDQLSANVGGTNINSSYNAATEKLTLTGSDTLAHYQQVLDTLTFVSTSDNPDNFGSNPTRTVVWTLNDGSASNAITTATTTIDIAAINDFPTLTNVATTAQFTENGAALTLSGAATVSDPDNQTLVGATVAITSGTFAGDGDVLAANTAGTNITALYDPNFEILFLSGSDTLAHYQQV